MQILQEGIRRLFYMCFSKYLNKTKHVKYVSFIKKNYQVKSTFTSLDELLFNSKKLKIMEDIKFKKTNV